MSRTLAEGSAERDGCAAPYQRHRPERTLLYQIVEQHYPAFVIHMAQQERPLPDYVQQQTARFLPQLWGAAHGRERGPVGRRGVARAAHAPVAVEFPVPTAFPVCQPGYRLYTLLRVTRKMWKRLA